MLHSVDVVGMSVKPSTTSASHQGATASCHSVDYQNI